MIGIIGAMHLETEAIRQEMTDAVTETISGSDYVRGMLWGIPAVVATCGPGKVFAAVCAQTMALRYRVDRVINVGVGGTLSPDLHIGDVAIATSTVQHDFDTSALGDPVGLVARINVTYFACDAALVQSAVDAASALGISHRTGVVASGDRFVADRQVKEAITTHFGAIACEMEGGAIGHVCYLNQLPYLVLRAISDEADGGAPTDFTSFARSSAAQTVRLLHAMLAQ